MKKEAKIGLTGIVALVLLFLGINFLKGMSLFSSQNTYYILFNNAKGLNKSSTVFADGYNVGIVSDIHYDYAHPGQVVVEIAADKSLRIPKGSSAMLDEAMLGGCTLNMLLTTNLTDSYHPGDTIIGTESNGLMSKAAEMIPQLEQVVAKVDTLIASLNRLAADPNLPLILQNAELMTENLNKSTVQLNRLLNKDIPEMAKTFNTAGENVCVLTDKLAKIDLQSTMDSVNTVAASVHSMIEQMQSTDGTLGLFMKDHTLYDNLNNTVRSADSLVTDLKANPKRYVHFSVFGKK